MSDLLRRLMRLEALWPACHRCPPPGSWLAVLPTLDAPQPACEGCGRAPDKVYVGFDPGVV